MMSMNNSNRDLLVLFKQELMTPQAIEHEVAWLHGLLYHVERLDNFVNAHELLNLNKFKITNNPVEIKKMIRRKKETAFIFLNNKN